MVSALPSPPVNVYSLLLHATTNYYSTSNLHEPCGFFKFILYDALISWGLVDPGRGSPSLVN